MNVTRWIPAIIAMGAVTISAVAEPAAPEEKSPAKKEEAADLRVRLLGSWRFKFKDADMSADGITTYKDDGTWISKGNFVFGDEQTEVEMEGKWKLDGRKLSFEVTRTNLPDLMEVGMKWTETVISITDTEFRYKDDEDGKESVETRVKPGEKP